MKKLKAKKDLTHQGKQHKAGDVFDAQDQEATALVNSGQAEEHTEHGDTGEAPIKPSR